MDWPALTCASRDPNTMLSTTLAEWSARHAAVSNGDLWLFGYASLIWRPDVDAVEKRSGTVHGWHRALEMRSRINRGTPECPGLVFALVSGGSCRGMVYRLAGDGAREQLTALWSREMPTGVYDPRWLRCFTPQGPVTALAFTLSRQSPNHTGRLEPAQMLEVLKSATGRYGSTLDYLKETERSLHGCGIRDRRVSALMALARQHGLV